MLVSLVLQSRVTVLSASSWCFAPLVILPNSFLCPTHVLSNVPVHVRHYDG